MDAGRPAGVRAKPGVGDRGGIRVVGAQIPRHDVVDPIEVGPKGGAVHAEVVGQNAIEIVGVELPRERQLPGVAEAGNPIRPSAGAGQRRQQ